MKKLSHKTIEELLQLIENANPRKTFGEFFNALVKQYALVLEKSGSPDRACFSYRTNKDYSVFFESSEGVIRAMDGSVKFCEVSFFRKYQINLKASPLRSNENLERFFMDTCSLRSDVRAVSDALEELGFGYETNSLVGEFLIGHHKTYVTVDLRNVEKFINISMKVRPVYKS